MGWATSQAKGTGHEEAIGRGPRVLLARMEGGTA
jgi:hypothetical protein